MNGRSPFSRRDMLKAGGAAAILAGAGPLIGTAQAAAGKQGVQVPGFYRFNLGAFEITMISDGNLMLPAAMVAANVPEAERSAFLKSYYLDTERHFAHVNLCLINTGEKLVLIDAGSGLNFQPTAGKVVDNLRAAGHEPDEIDTVVITHSHPDHVWGIIDSFEEAPRFPTAEYVIHKVEWDFWTAEDAVDKLPDRFKGFAIGARKNLLPVSARTKRVEPQAEVVPGVRLEPSAGHTVGHSSVMVESEGERLLITGDAINHPYVSFAHPGWHPAVDMQPKVAESSRKRLLDMAATDRLMVACYHLPFPGVGHVARTGRTYRWVPALWQWDL